MTHAQVSNPAQPGDHSQEGTTVADDRIPPALSDTCTNSAPARAENMVDGPTQRVPRALIDDLDGTTGTPPERVADDSAGDVAVSVWTTAQTSPAAQRKGRYTP